MRRLSLRTRPPAWLWALVAAAAYLILSLHLPVTIAGDAGLDDAWFADRARDLIKGRWLGPYSDVTLVKGAGYPMFLALNALAGWPITLSQSLLQIAACALLARAASRLGAPGPLAWAIFLICLFHPYLAPPKPNRDALYATQTLLYVALLLHALTAASPTGRRAWSLAAGLALAWVWISREEGVWLLPATAVIMIGALWRDRSRWVEGARIMVVWGAVVTLLVLGNFAAYRTFARVEFTAGAYPRAVKALQSVRAGPPQAYVPVPAKVRAAIYPVSPAFAVLKPYLEGEGRFWTKPGCGIYPSTCGDYAGGWFIWALRDAVAASGHYRTAAEADRFYGVLANEVRAACRDRRLTCSEGLIGYMPSITLEQWRSLPSKLAGLRDLLIVHAPLADRADSSGSPTQLQVMWSFMGFPRRTPTGAERALDISAWYYAPPQVWLQARCPPDRGGVLPIGRADSPDLVTHFHDPAAIRQRFALTLPSDSACVLQRDGAGPAEEALNLSSAKAGSRLTLAGHPLYVEVAARRSAAPDADAALGVLGGLRRLYGLFTPVLLLAAALAYGAYVLRTVRGGRGPSGYGWAVHALWLAVACRALVLLLVELSAFPGLTIPYLSPAFPLLDAAALMTLALPVLTVANAANSKAE